MELRARCSPRGDLRTPFFFFLFVSAHNSELDSRLQNEPSGKIIHDIEYRLRCSCGIHFRNTKSHTPYN